MERTEYETMAAVELRHWWYGGMRAINAALLDPIYGARRDMRILDAGCGTGGDALFLHRYGEVVGVDMAAEAIRLGAPRLPGSLARASVMQLPFAGDSFDLATSFDVIYHQGVPDEVAALREVRRILKPGGHLLIRLPAYEFLRSRHDEQVHTRRRYTATSARALLAEAGFFLKRWTYAMSLLFPLALTQRMLERVMPAATAPASAMTMPSPLANTVLGWPLALEAALIELGGVFPFGLSVVCLAHCGKIHRITPPARKRHEPRNEDRTVHSST